MDKLIIEVAINESRRKRENPHVPYSIDEIVADAIACARAGAAIVHFHPRDPKTEQTIYHDKATYKPIFDAVRKECDVVLYPTYTFVEPLEERYSHFYPNADGSYLDFEMAPLGLQPTDEEIAYSIKVTNRPGMVYNWALSELAQLERLCGLIERGVVPSPLNVRFYWHPPRAAPGFSDVHEGVSPDVYGLLEMLGRIPNGIPFRWFTMTILHRPWNLWALAAAMGGHIRTGIGDNPVIDGVQYTNADLVARVAKLAELAGREVANAAAARSILGIPAR